MEEEKHMHNFVAQEITSQWSGAPFIIVVCSSCGASPQPLILSNL